MAAFAVVGGVVGGSGLPYFAPEIVRPDPFTSIQAQKLEERVRRDFNHRMEVHELQVLSKFRTDVPPPSVKARLQAIERSLQRFDPEFRSPIERYTD